MSRTETPREHQFRDERRRTGRRAIAVRLALAVAGLGAALAPAPAQAGTFEVSQCNELTDEGTLITGAAAGYQSSVWSSGGVASHRSGCTGSTDFLGIYHPNHRLYADETAGHGLNLPASMSGTTIEHVDASFIAEAQSPSTNEASLRVMSGGTTLEQISTGTYIAPRRYTPPVGSRNVEFYMWCSPGNGAGYCNWNGDSWTLRALTLQLEESTAPSGDASGPLLSGGNQSGLRPLDVNGSDADSGVKKIDVTLDGIGVGSFDFGSGCRIDRFSPCATSVSQAIDVDTTKVPDGSRLLRLVVTDLAGNAKTINKGYVTVENVPPPSNSSIPTVSGEKRVNRMLIGTAGTWTGDDIAYAYRWERYAENGWENIPDATQATFTTTKHETGMRLRLKVTATNVEGSTIAYSDITNAIVAPGPTDGDGDFDGDGLVNDVDADDDGDGTADPQDIAPFDPTASTPPAPATATPTSGARAGSSAGSTETPNGAGASAGASLVSTFDGSRAKRINIRYGQTRRVTGQLLTSRGAPLVAATLNVTSQVLAVGARSEAIGTVTTDVNGRFSYTIPAGPSRRITVAYKWFREASAYTHTTAVTVNVRPKIALKVNKASLRNNQAVRFTGKVLGVPRGLTRLVEIQARDGRTWRTFATVRLSKTNGSFAHTYRFRRTTRPTRYQFRVNVKADQGWPFLAGHSNTRKVAVRP